MSHDTVTFIIPMDTEKFYKSQIEYLLPDIFMTVATGEEKHLANAVDTYCRCIPDSDLAMEEEGIYRRDYKKMVDEVIPILTKYLNEKDKELITDYTKDSSNIEVEVVNNNMIRVTVINEESR